MSHQMTSIQQDKAIKYTPSPFKPSVPLKAPTTKESALANSSPNLSATDLLKLELLGSFKKYVALMFKAQHGRSFVMAWHHERIINVLEQVIDGRITKLIINMPPRYSKTELAIKQFISYGYALNPQCNFLHLSYSDLLVNDNSEHIRTIMRMPIYKELFPESALMKESGSAERWKTKNNGEFYGVSTQGQVTGFGAGRVESAESQYTDQWLLSLDDDFLKKLGSIEAYSNVFSGAVLIDDPIKPLDAQSDTIRNRVNQNFELTIRNRVNSRNTPIIIIMQRVHEMDLCGYLLDIEPDEWTVLTIPAILEHPETGKEYALWPFKHTLEELYKIRRADALIFDTQYLQEPTPKEGLMYEEFGVYTTIPNDTRWNKKYSYTDTADTGSDFLCSIIFVMGEEYNYVIDVIYTTEPMEVTEPLLAKAHTENRVSEARIESNNGGRGFARAVQRIMRTSYQNFFTKVTWFFQTQNKQARIYTNSASVNNVTLFPVGWDRKWPAFYNAVTRYRKDNKKSSKFDDAVDALTGTYEMRESVSKKRKIRIVNR